jgi:hypothetical protein
MNFAEDNPGAKDYRKCQRDFFIEQKKSLNGALIVSIT